jgi:hypothetical protein
MTHLTDESPGHRRSAVSEQGIYWEMLFPRELLRSKSTKFLKPASRNVARLKPHSRTMPFLRNMTSQRAS